MTTELKKRYISFLFIALAFGCKPKNNTLNNKVHTDAVNPDGSPVKEKKNSAKDEKDGKTPVVDTLAVLAAFNKAIQTDQFIKELDINNLDSSGGAIYASERPILIGDLNNDRLNDALMPFSIEGRGGGNNWEAYYAIFLNKQGRLEYKYSFARGGKIAEKVITFSSIQGGIISGKDVPNELPQEGGGTPLHYVYGKNNLSVSPIVPEKNKI